MFSLAAHAPQVLGQLLLDPPIRRALILWTSSVSRSTSASVIFVDRTRHDAAKNVSMVRNIRAARARNGLAVPRTAVELPAPIPAHMAADPGVSVVPAHAESTTQQAVDLLGVSRPFLIGLLEAGRACRRVGKHRRVQTASLLEYRRRDDRQRRKGADELTASNRVDQRSSQAGADVGEGADGLPDPGVGGGVEGVDPVAYLVGA